jgi:RHH-type proline utilization regulon transcriptional repressor/proline dehydrogenase/delta 1-pyrroline-5-carboxylate dehydrogenase
MLYGMEAGLAGAVRSLGPRVNVYVPIGELVPGLSYLVRRLLENSSNESFLRQANQASELDALLRPPAVAEEVAA